MVNEEMFKKGNNASAIRELFAFGKKQKALLGEDKVFDFSIGNPSVPTSKEVNDELIRLIKETDPCQLHGYTMAQGDLDVRNQIAEDLNQRYGCNETGELIYLTQGAAASLTISLKALLNPGEEVIVFAPFFPEYKVFIENAGGKIVIVNPDRETFYPDLNDFEKKINEKTKAIIINSPNNPTGVCYPEEIIKKISNILLAKQNEYEHDIYLCSDEPYRELIYVDIKYPFVTNYYDNSLVFYSFSKSASLPGERIGYILVSNKCNDKERVYKAICGAGRSQGFVCASSLFQFVLPVAIKAKVNIDAYKENRDALCSGLDKLGYEYIPSYGAFYLFMKALEDDANAFMENAKRFNLLLVPSDSFGCRGYVRIAYCVSKKQIENSMEAFKKLKDFYDNRG